MDKLIGNNTLLLRDYSSFISNTVNIIKNITNEWTDFTISEPDSIILNNIAYINDVLSYTIDKKFLDSSLRYTTDDLFVNTIYRITGAFLPDNKKDYYLNIDCTKLKNYKLLEKGFVLYEYNTDRAVTVIEDILLVPGSRVKVKVVPGYIYNFSTKINTLTELYTKYNINVSSIIDISDYRKLLENSISKIVYDYLVDKNYRNKVWISTNDNYYNLSLFGLSRNNDNIFIGFTIKDDIIDYTSIDLSPVDKNLSSDLYIEGSNNSYDIIDKKFYYLQSLDKVFTDINKNSFSYNLDRYYNKLNYIDKLSMVFNNNRNSLISKSYVNYVEGYIDLFCNILKDSIINISYDYYDNDTNISSNKKLSVHTYETKSTLSIDLLLDNNCTIKSNSLVIEIINENYKNNIYITDYKGSLIIPRGNSVSIDYRYKLYNDKEYDYTDFNIGYCSVIRTITTYDSINLIDRIKINNRRYGYNKTISSNVLDTKISKTYRITLLTQTEEVIYIKDNKYVLPRNNLSYIDIYNVDSDYLDIRTSYGNIYRAFEDNYIKLLSISYYPNLLFYNNYRIYFILNNYNIINYDIKITLDNICTYYSRINIYDKVSLTNVSLFYINILDYYINNFGNPREIKIEIDNRIYYCNVDNNYNNDNYYNLFYQSGIINNIDLYDIPIQLIKVNKLEIKYLELSVYLKTFDIDIDNFKKDLKSSIVKYVDSLSIGESFRITNVISSIINNDNILYVEIIYPKEDILTNPNQYISLSEKSIFINCYKSHIKG